MASLLSTGGRRLLATTSRTAAAAGSTSTSSLATSTTALRCFSTTSPTSKKSNRARGATRKSPRNQAIFAALSPRLAAPVNAGKSKGKSGKRGASSLEPVEGETLLTLEQAVEELKAADKGVKTRPMNAFEVHIVTSVSTHQTNALRGRIAFPRDPRTKQERLLIFAEEGSEAAEAVKDMIKAEGSNTTTTTTSSSSSSDSDSNKNKAAHTNNTNATAAEADPSPSTSTPKPDTSTSASPTPTTAAAAAAGAGASSGSSGSHEPSIIVGGSELISQVLNNRVSGFTKVLCTSALLPEVSKGLARSLGPKGLMPNPRRGTVVPSDSKSAILNAIRQSRGATDWRSDKVGVIRGAVGRLHFDNLDVRKNVATLIDAIVAKVPTLGLQQSAASGAGGGQQTQGGSANEFVEREKRSPSELRRAAAIVRQVHISSTQGPAYKLDLRDVLA
ncbi:ribosomal protein L1 [Testicularia cyperi]|uniref:Ribosomal protein L1 n=1 Tax=Testicularia cyperi TaxID=1882483 RepID=A0A317XGD9_9BASI|nr:ribosomal protein L1 [Testicularia cyperi]